MIVLTQRYGALPLEEGCIKLVGAAPAFTRDSCAGRYLLVKRGAGVYLERRPVKPEGLAFYIAVGPPRRVEYAGGGFRFGDGLDLFHGFAKRGLWRELTPSLHAAVSTYAARCAYCTAHIEAAYSRRPASSRAPGVYIEVEGRAGRYRAVAVSLPGRSNAFREAVAKLLDEAEAIYSIRLGAAVDTPLDLYLQPPVPLYRLAPAPAIAAVARGNG
ncbi:hypothetical protein [Pyrobaculum neutrophilum]|uniref:Uncharacterized protein n=1 Tax=Pyrobaculum neutrophilum (strain DSM 2338 / JCM 9278 / NBRC 100436 / V24Sta) TaxID=444157 RepID=B1YBJ6_PYRNV|nr:hypothetical protein [Pyrobaculum neutrophilum]ACB40798.1 conserved hypothetical protein [Pyrobaculum neutrophilum V24Sta]